MFTTSTLILKALEPFNFAHLLALFYISLRQATTQMSVNSRMDINNSWHISCTKKLEAMKICLPNILLSEKKLGTRVPIIRFLLYKSSKMGKTD